MAGLGVLVDVDDLAFVADDVVRFAPAAQVQRVQAGVEVEGIIPAPAVVRILLVGQAEPSARRGLAGEADVVEARRGSGEPLLDPILLERDGIEVLPVIAERVEIAVALAAPVDELDPELEGGLGGPDEFGLVEAERMVEPAQRGNGGFADADGADLIRFDQLDPKALLERIAHPRRRHPASRAAANDQHRPDRIRSRSIVVAHPVYSLVIRRARTLALPGLRRKGGAARPIKRTRDAARWFAA